MAVQQWIDCCCHSESIQMASQKFVDLIGGDKRSGDG
jgi:hypothetical protein